jgi:hypothetical protein
MSPELFLLLIGLLAIAGFLAGFLLEHFLHHR